MNDLFESLVPWGWTAKWAEAFQAAAEPGMMPGRVIAEHKQLYTVQTIHGELLAEVTGKFRFAATGREHYPAVGDWVVLTARPDDGRATIHAILPRKSKFSRKQAGAVSDEQIAAVNVDTVFLVAALNYDFNLRRLERYLIAAWESGAQPVIVLSKADLCDDPALYTAETEGIAPGVPVHAVSVVTGEGMEELRAYLLPGHTLTLLGSSGAGKSSLTNYLAGKEIMATQGIREDDSRGRHTTTHRELIPLVDDAMIIDTPGMRELQLVSADEGFGEAFSDIEELADSCRFGDCTHRKEPGCAVRTALQAGTLEQARYDSYRKLEAELAFITRREQQRQRMLEKGSRKQTGTSRMQVRDAQQDD